MSNARNLANIASKSSDLKAGTTAFFAMSSAPAGWVKANGAAVSRTAYADLFAAIGTVFGSGDGSTTFNLPDLRGEFPRGLDDGRGVDSGRSLGTAQGDSFKSHGHTVMFYPAGGAYVSYYPGLPGHSGGPDTGANNTTNTGGSETRPRNIALLACVKY